MEKDLIEAIIKEASEFGSLLAFLFFLAVFFSSGHYVFGTILLIAPILMGYLETKKIK